MPTLSNITAMILAGGLGTRLRSAVADRPKVLAEVGGRPFLAYVLDELIGAGVRHVVLCTGDRAEMVEEAFGATYRSLKLSYSREMEPRGTGGALRAALAYTTSPTILAANGDSLCRADLPAMLARHRATAAAVTILLSEAADTSQFGRVETDPDDRVIEFCEKGRHAGPGWINAGVYLFQRRVLQDLPPGVTVSLEREVFPRLDANCLLGFKTTTRSYDIGTPESYRAAAAFVAAGNGQRRAPSIQIPARRK